MRLAQQTMGVSPGILKFSFAQPRSVFFLPPRSLYLLILTAWPQLASFSLSTSRTEFQAAASLLLHKTEGAPECGLRLTNNGKSPPQRALQYVTRC
jgi:hypothetical protein